MGETLTMSEIEERFDSEWVLLADPETTDTLHVRAGRLLLHSRDRDEVYSKALQLRPVHSAVLYIGKLPDDSDIVL